MIITVTAVMKEESLVTSQRDKRTIRKKSTLMSHLVTKHGFVGIDRNPGVNENYYDLAEIQ